MGTVDVDRQRIFIRYYFVSTANASKENFIRFPASSKTALNLTLVLGNGEDGHPPGDIDLDGYSDPC